MIILPPVIALLSMVGWPTDLPLQEEYVLVWSDEFDRGDRPDSSKWGYEYGYVRNEEDQWYQPDNARVENGLLVIEGRRESRPNPDYAPGSDDWRKSRERINYTSSLIHTRDGRGEWLYGRFELKAKIPVGTGIWPAWWTLGGTGRWPANGEIDIMEYYDDQLLANVACLGADGRAKWYANKFPVGELPGGDAWSDDFHIWRMDWDEEAIALYLDDRLLNRVPLDSLYNRNRHRLNPFRQPHYMLINLALGGINGGPLDNTPLPVKLVVDYVRVYQRPNY